MQDFQIEFITLLIGTQNTHNRVEYVKSFSLHPVSKVYGFVASSGNVREVGYLQIHTLEYI